jgi:hypothetical protein
MLLALGLRVLQAPRPNWSGRNLFVLWAVAIGLGVVIHLAIAHFVPSATRSRRNG